MASAHAQELLEIPGRQLMFGESQNVSTRIINGGTQPSRMFFQYEADNAGNEFATLNDSLLKKSLLDGLEPADTLYLEIAKRVLALTKNPDFNADMWLADPLTSDDPLKLSSAWGSSMGTLHGKNSQKCGDYAHIFIQLCAIAGIPKDSLRFASADKSHTVAEIFCKGTWNGVDPDPWMVVSMIRSNTSPSGFASTHDWKYDTSLVAERYLFEGIDLRPFHPTDVYLMWWRNNPLSNYAAPSFAGEAMDGDVLLCAGCEIKYDYQTPRYWIDISQAANKFAYDSMRALFVLYERGMVSGQQMNAAINSLNSSYFHVPNFIRAFQAEDAVFGKNGQVFKPSYLGRQTTLTFRIPPSADTVVIGRDVKYPGLVTKVVASGPVSIDGTIASGDTFVWYGMDELWGVSADSVKYFQKGFIPPNTEAVITVSATTRLIGFYEGFDLWIFDDNDDITVYRDGVPVQVATEVEKIPSTSVAVFPNPASSIVTARGDFLSDRVDIYCLDGRVACSALPKEGIATFDVSGLPQGTYFVSSGGAHKKLIVAR